MSPATTALRRWTSFAGPTARGSARRRSWARSPCSRSASRSPDVMDPATIDRDDPEAARSSPSASSRAVSAARASPARSRCSRSPSSARSSRPRPARRPDLRSGRRVAAARRLRRRRLAVAVVGRRARASHAAAIWAQARPTASPDAPWTRYAAWASATDDHVELVLISRARLGRRSGAFAVHDDRQAAPRSRRDRRCRRSRWRRCAIRPPSSRPAPTSTISRRSRPRRASPTTTRCAPSTKPRDAEQQRAEIEMRRELAEQEAAERRAQAAAVARALRRP